MKSFIGAVIFICVALSANAQLLWKVSGNGLSSPSYIMGTHHLAPLSVKDGITGLQKAMDDRFTGSNFRKETAQEKLERLKQLMKQRKESL